MRGSNDVVVWLMIIVLYCTGCEMQSDIAMMNERRRTLQTVKVDHYDGQSIYSNSELIYELGGYLGGGAAGVYV